jgi:thiamine pyrophosphokinase
MERKNALIVGNGEPLSPELFEELMADGPLLLCADGGANAVARYGWTPDYVVGDLDSVTEENKIGLPDERLVLVDADDTGTDLQKALRQAKKLGVTEATLIGVTGGRTDHTLWNLSLLKLFGGDMALRIVDDYCEIRLIREKVRFRAEVGQKISLSPLSGPVVGVRTAGLRFPLRGEVLGPGIRDGISNKVVGDPVEVSVEAGDLLLVVQREEGMGEIEWEAG